jgi:hypothetical protein
LPWGFMWTHLPLLSVSVCSRTSMWNKRPCVSLSLSFN